MFNQLVVSGEQEGTHKRWTVATSFGVQLIIVGIMILIPLIYTQALPKGMLNTFLVAPPPPPPPPPPAPKVVKAPPKIIPMSRVVAPTVIPRNIAVVKDEAPTMYVNDGGVLGGSGAGVLGSIIGSGGPAP